MLAPWVLFLRVMIVTSSMPALAWTAVPALTPVPTALSAPLNNRAKNDEKSDRRMPVTFFVAETRDLYYNTVSYE